MYQSLLSLILQVRCMLPATD